MKTFLILVLAVYANSPPVRTVIVLPPDATQEECIATAKDLFEVLKKEDPKSTFSVACATLSEGDDLDV